MSILLKKTRSGSRLPRRFVPILETLEQRSLLAAIGHLHAPVEPEAADQAIAVESTAPTITSDTTKTATRSPAAEQRAVIADPSAAQLADAVLSVTTALADSSSQDQTQSSAGLDGALLSAGHGSHSQPAFDLPLQSHGDHSAPIVSQASATPLPGQSHAHSEGPESIAARQFGQADAALFQDDMAGESHHERDSVQKSESSQKFAPKRCTVRYTSKEAYRDVTGERKCDCPQKATAEGGRRETFDEGAAPAVVFASNELLDCLPCQLDLATNGAVCRLASSLDAATESGERCEAQRPGDDAWDRDVTSFYEGLQIVGWTLVGTSVMAISLSGKRTNDDTRESKRTALDRFFGGFGLEILPR
jgi:hypothetical protein